eukprot:jgi/Bigna1/33495/e_gw1.2.107.1
MEAVALVSGGKDSCMAILKSQQYGHRIVAIANLIPENTEHDEVDSYMYQTVGHSIIKTIAEAIGVPLFQRKIKGKPINTQVLQFPIGKIHYEVEDLHILLEEVTKALPSIKCVCSGAILSNYQRNRVENVCDRLGLVSLAYLWQRDQSDLLREMVFDAGIDAVLVKVASMGLNPHKHLGKSLKDLYPFLTGEFKDMGCHPCGEGGEYETLTLDCPFFRKTIQINKSTLVGDLTTDIAPVALLRIEDVSLIPKGGGGEKRTSLKGHVVKGDGQSPTTPKKGDVKRTKRRYQAGKRDGRMQLLLYKRLSVLHVHPFSHSLRESC